ncbi:MAG: 16S rRNA (guanine(966)-N(2))-methyltransferase RsmD [Deltaproteobacteria bacterium]|jgi:16S rRNA (guanine966-N2)-methyltransferase|nr:16S rRNA (guanine(966)-N(2))-methyltransferase RsmD [Deltaproteobacteria bacterium]
MRVTAGAERGRKLRAPRGANTRPTGAKVREAIFNILGPLSPDAVLDLYAGTGALGIEALSRGARCATFVERDGRALAALHRNLRQFDLTSRARVMETSVTVALQRLCCEKSQRFSCVFLDPPYAAGEVEPVLALLSDGRVLDNGAVVIVEHDRRHLPPERVGALQLVDRRSYGDTGLSFYRRQRELA